MHLEIDLPTYLNASPLNKIRNRIFILTIKTDFYSWLCGLDFYFAGSVHFERHDRTIHIYLPGDALYSLFSLSFQPDELDGNRYRLNKEKISFMKRFVGSLRAYFLI